MQQYYCVVKNFFQKVNPSIITDTFFELENELDKIFLTNSEPMMGILKLKWWEDRLKQINQESQQVPILNKITMNFSKEQLDHLLKFIQAKSQEVERYKIHDLENFVNDYFYPIAKVKSFILLNQNQLSPVILCIELIKFLELLELYKKKGWVLPVGMDKFLVERIKKEFKYSKANLKLEKLFYKSVQIFINNIKCNEITLSKSSFRMRLAWYMLFNG